MILNDEEETSLTEKLADVRAITGHPFVVVSVPSLDGKDVATFTEDLANRWGVGREGAYDGVVLLIAVADRRARIAIGRGLQSELTDTYGQQVMDELIIPLFRRGDLPGGINAGVDALIAKLISSQNEGVEEGTALTPLNIRWSMKQAAARQLEVGTSLTIGTSM